MSQTSSHHHYPHHQQLTPPAVTSSMSYSYDNIEEPQAVQTTTAPGYGIDSYSYHSSRDDTLATTMEYSYNSYTTTTSAPEESNGSSGGYFASAINGHSGYMGHGQRLPPPTSPYASSAYPPPMSHQHSPQGLAPIIPQPRQHGYNQGRHSGEYPDAPHMPSLNMGQHPGNDRLPLTSPTNEQSRTPRTDAAFNSFSVVSVDSTGSGSQPADMSASIPEDVRNLVIASGDEVTLNSKASDEDRFLFELHRKYKNSRGKGMWEAIGKEYLKAYPGDRDHSNARLQMRHTRALRRNAQWPEEVYNTLVHIYETQERAKYAAYAAMLKDKVGTKYGEFKAADVEAMLVRIGFEDPIPDTNSKARRRQHNNLRKKSENGQLPVSAMPNAWGNGFAAVPTTQFPLPSPHGQSIAVDHYDYRQARQLAVPIPTFNDATEEKFLDTLVERHGDGTGRMDSDDSRNSNSSNSPVDYTMATGNADGSLSTFQQGSPSPYPSGARRLKSEYQ